MPWWVPVGASLLLAGAMVVGSRGESDDDVNDGAEERLSDEVEFDENEIEELLDCIDSEQIAERVPGFLRVFEGTFTSDHIDHRTKQRAILAAALSPERIEVSIRQGIVQRLRNERRTAKLLEWCRTPAMERLRDLRKKGVAAGEQSCEAYLDEAGDKTGERSQLIHTLFNDLQDRPGRTRSLYALLRVFELAHTWSERQVKLEPGFESTYAGWIHPTLIVVRTARNDLSCALSGHTDLEIRALIKSLYSGAAAWGLKILDDAWIQVAADAERWTRDVAIKERKFE